MTQDLDKIRDEVASLNVSPIPKLNEKSTKAIGRHGSIKASG